MERGPVLITGAAGYLGRNLARRYLERTDANLVLAVHQATSEEGLGSSELRAAVEPIAARVRYHVTDLRAPYPFEGIDPGSIRTIIHTAAVTRFNVDAETARAVNVEGMEKLLTFAERCPRLEGLALLSSVYASGLRPGAIDEVALDDHCGFANHYEWSKWASERLVVERDGQLPWRIFRLATIIAENGEGLVRQQNAFHNTLRLFYYGLLSIIPGKPDTVLYLTTEEFTSDAIFSLMAREERGVIYHVSPTASQSIALGEMVDRAFGVFERREDFKRRRVLKPLYSDAESFELLVQGVRGFAGGVVSQAIESIAPFAPQLFVQKQIRNDRLESALPDHRPPDARDLIENTCDYLAHTRWGRKA